MTDAKPRRTPKKATTATADASTVDAAVPVVELVPAVDASDAPATAPRTRAKKTTPAAAGVAASGAAAAEAAPVKPVARRKTAAAPGAAAAPEAAAPEAAPRKPAAASRKPAARRKAVAADAAEPATDAAAEAPAAAMSKRPGLPLREPSQARKRPAKKVTDAVGDGSIDPGEPDPFALAMARRIVDVAEDKKASDIVLLDVRALTAVTDYFIICSGMSERQLGAIADGIGEALKAELKVLPIGREGGANAHWVLIDFGSAIVHVMSTPEREFYQLEKLWADAKVLLHVL